MTLPDDLETVVEALEAICDFAESHVRNRTLEKRTRNNLLSLSDKSEDFQKMVKQTCEQLGPITVS